MVKLHVDILTKEQMTMQKVRIEKCISIEHVESF